ncbi:MAG: A24 family peptidase [Phycisphaerales bacterium]|nr:A24 family peptidase [Phycisphaerales bacterium]MCB9858053.1 A24 family peptidase [Phycisphaerales bacterium]MCB9864150.1 A24 family peptidase [Phycisphaerales bacterium]
MTAAAYGVIAAGIFGSIIGSFLNVVIFRLPRGLSIAQPRWSFCPRCEQRIRPHHNLPIVGWFLLRGKCAACGQPISAIYPTIEALTALVFMIVWDALFVAKLVPAVLGPAGDWGILIAWLSLFACLLAISAMDIESYMIDVRALNLAMVLGVVGHGIWWFRRGADFAGPFLSGDDGSAGFVPSLVPRDVPRNLIDALPPAVSICACAGGLAWVVTFIVLRLFGVKATFDELKDMEHRASAPDDGEGDSHAGEGSVEQTAYLTGGAGGFRPLPVILLCAVILVIGIWQIAENAHVIGAAADRWRGMLSCVTLMAVIVMSSLDSREADEQIIEEIESERSQARRMAMREFAHFVPSLIVGFGLFFYYRSTHQLDTALSALMGVTGYSAWMGALGGAAYAGSGLVLGAAIGWFVRIGGTLAFGKEAFGSGDIFILAAIGASLGFWGAFFSFFLSVFLALGGVLLTLFAKKSRALPFGPWLTLGAVVYLWVGPALMAYFSSAGNGIWSLICDTAGVRH